MIAPDTFPDAPVFVHVTEPAVCAHCNHDLPETAITRVVQGYVANWTHNRGGEWIASVMHGDFDTASRLASQVWSTREEAEAALLKPA